MGVRTDWPTFSATLVVLLGICVPLLVMQEQANDFINAAFGVMTSQFGILYLWGGIAAVGLLLWLAMSRFGQVKLGSPDDAPEFSAFSWAGMLFCAGIGSGILYWGTIEWAYYLQAPPMGITPNSDMAAEWAATYGMFHWGITAWAFYGVPAIPLAYLYHVRKQPELKLSAACEGVLGKYVHGPLGKVIDILFMFGLLGGVGTSLGLGTPMVAAGFSEFFGIENSFGLSIFVMLLCTAIFAISAYSGLKKGIKVLSDINVWLAIALLVFIVIAGPTLFILKTTTNSIGLMFQNFIHMNFWTDPVTNSGFPEGWTIFYWAWWIAYGPFMGLFVAKISRGRTIRQVVTGMLVFGSIGCWAYFGALGNYAMHLELNDILSVTTLLNEQDAPTAIIAVINSLPLSSIVLPLFCILALIFLATQFDSAAYTMAAVATVELKEDEHPARWQRLFWAFALAALPLSLMFVGGLKALQTAAITLALPQLFITAFMAISLVRWLRQDEKSGVPVYHPSRLNEESDSNAEPAVVASL
ncbi:choline transporter [Hahella sp. CCB-MM4]|uniref:BCCT family transporter n=1 Tax=Hahella sp. (strain CCB-MM4) TaxID=1926491 RepID=UPI000B9BBFB5|nr:BCCT family transporter [Hahella sp. CCB-MM4]OZG75382.1 choline transporter [Hahella sp. CCB-MM4]